MRRRASRTRARRTTPGGSSVQARGPAERRMDLRERVALMTPRGSACGVRADGPHGGRTGRGCLLLAGLLAARGRTLSGGSSTILLLDAGVDLLAVHLHLGRRLDAELHLPRAHFEHGDLHRITDPDVLS